MDAQSAPQARETRAKPAAIPRDPQVILTVLDNGELKDHRVRPLLQHASFAPAALELLDRDRMAASKPEAPLTPRAQAIASTPRNEFLAAEAEGAGAAAGA